MKTAEGYRAEAEFTDIERIMHISFPANGEIEHYV
jgi:hypothetical protein